MIEPAVMPERPQARRFVALIVIAAATAQCLGVALRMPTQLVANDVSRYCTVWALLERGTYAIDDCPWQKETQDKVRKSEPFSKQSPAPKHVYSSKPPLFATIMAGVIYPFRKLTGVPLDAKVKQPRVERNVEKETSPGVVTFVKETPGPVEWPAYVLYFKPVILLFNVVPFLMFLIVYARLLDRYAPNDWAWFLSLVAASYGNLLVVFNASLNNHTVAAYSGFFAVNALIRIWDRGPGKTASVDELAPAIAAGNPKGSTFVAAGFFGAFCACNELPAALFGVLLFGLVAIRDWRKTLIYFVPAAIVPVAAFLATQYIAIGQFKPVYEEFGTESYNYAGSYWNTPLEFDYFNKFPEPKWVYLFHMTFGHHGVFSLTPIYLFAIVAAVRNVFGKGRTLRAVSGVTLVLTLAMLAFYGLYGDARNYGGSTQGLRWLFWLIPFWLVVLPTGLASGQDRKGMRWLGVAAIAVSALTVGYGIRSPWNHPWILDAIDRLGLYPLVR